LIAARRVGDKVGGYYVSGHYLKTYTNNLVLYRRAIDWHVGRRFVQRRGQPGAATRDPDRPGRRDHRRARRRRAHARTRASVTVRGVSATSRRGPPAHARVRA
jgi:hypothetical protein